MPETDPATEPARRRHRPTILLLMAVIAAAALALGVFKHRRDTAAWEARRALLTSDLARARGRAEWADRMHQQGYISAAQAKAEHVAWQRASEELKAFEGR